MLLMYIGMSFSFGLSSFMLAVAKLSSAVFFALTSGLRTYNQTHSIKCTHTHPDSHMHAHRNMRAHKPGICKVHWSVLI